MAGFTKCVLALFCIFKFINSEDCPDGWSALKDEKCFLLLKYFSNYEVAKAHCVEEGGRLASIKDEEQQTFLKNLIIEAVGSTEVGVWIGATRRSDNLFWWEDDTPLEFANWGVGSPTDIDRRNCVAMNSKFFKLFSMDNSEGSWEDMSCSSPLYYVCEILPVWSSEEVRDVLIETRKQLNATQNALEESIKSLENALRNPVPIGFIYTQYPDQPLPSAIWPSVGWTEVTSMYEGKFFRALGGSSALFGDTQPADSPRLTRVYSKSGVIPANYAEPSIGRWSMFLSTGGTRLPTDRGTAVQFFVSAAETRPINTAIRIWTRSS